MTVSIDELEMIYAPIQSDLERVDQELWALTRHADRFVEKAAQHLLEHSGKKLRPALCLFASHRGLSLEFSSAMHPWTVPDKDRILLATIVELIHTATLIHDDVVDRAALRRKKPSLHAQMGEEVAVLAGDYLYARSFYLLSQLNRHDLFRVIADATQQMSEGELGQVKRRYDRSISEKEYLNFIQKKTASLIAASAQMGARLAGATEQQEASLYSYGLSLGMAFQIMDDVLDLTGNEQAVGKTLGTDLLYGKFTLPLIYMGEVKEIAPAAGSSFCVPQEFIKKATDKAQWHLKLARQALLPLPESAIKISLENLADYTVSRGR